MKDLRSLGNFLLTYKRFMIPLTQVYVRVITYANVFVTFIYSE